MGELMSSSKEIIYDEGLTDYADKYKKTIQREILQEIRQEIENEYNNFHNRSKIWAERCCGIASALEIIDKKIKELKT